MKYIVSIVFLMVACTSFIVSMSNKEKVCALVELWSDKNNWSLKQEPIQEKIKWDMSSYKWDIQPLLQPSKSWDEEAKELHYTGLVVYKTIDYAKIEKGRIEDFASVFKGAQITKNCSCFRNNKFFTLLPVSLKGETHLYLFRFPVNKEDAVLTFVKDLGIFNDAEQCDISYDSSSIRIALEDGTLHTITIKVPEELKFKPKK